MTTRTDAVSGGAGSWLERCFALREAGTNARREGVAGLATFMTMAYILFVNPAILSGTGMPREAVVAATCLGAALPTLLMGFWSNYPLALASGMGLNAALATAAMQPGMNWQTMMGVVVVEGTLVTLLVLAGVREQVMEAIPMQLKRAIGVGIGLFIAFLGLQHMGWVVAGTGGAILTRGTFATSTTLIATAGLLLVMALLAWRVRGAILLGILATTAFAWVGDQFSGAEAPLVRLPDRWIAMPDFSTFGQADLSHALQPAMIGLIFAFLMTDFFDTMGTVIGVAGQGGFLDAQGRLPRIRRVLLVDSLAAVWGGCCGASSVTSYVESAAGVSDGGRTGLVAVVVGILFLLSTFLAPTVGMVPSVATAPALVVVGFLMMGVVRDMNLHDAEEGLPAFLVIVLIPLTQSISCGIGIGFITAVFVKIVRGRAREVSLWMYGIALLFALSFLFGKA